MNCEVFDYEEEPKNESLVKTRSAVSNIQGNETGN